MEDLPDMGNKETNNMIDVSYDSLVNSFTIAEDHDERFQNGFGIDMVREGGYFCPVVHTAKGTMSFMLAICGRVQHPRSMACHTATPIRGEEDGTTLRRCLYPPPLLLVNFGTIHQNSMWKLEDGH
jgi:hypothetical protein